MRCALAERAADNDSIVAVHGIGAHPNDTWCELRESGLDVRDPASYVNWLSDPAMLPAVASSARIMCYGYHSAWFGAERLATAPRIVSQRLLGQLQLRREVRLSPFDCCRSYTPERRGLIAARNAPVAL